jgi:hypothetical protein
MNASVCEYPILPCIYIYLNSLRATELFVGIHWTHICLYSEGVVVKAEGSIQYIHTHFHNDADAGTYILSSKFTLEKKTLAAVKEQ